LPLHPPLAGGGKLNYFCDKLLCNSELQSTHLGYLSIEMQHELQGNGIIVPIELFQEWFPSGLFENLFRGFIFGKGFQVSIGL
jgi:hypothetical protein